MSAFDNLYAGVIPDTPVKPPRPPRSTGSVSGRTTRENSWFPNPNRSGYDAPTDIAPTSPPPPIKLPFHDELAMAHFSPTRHSVNNNDQSTVLGSPQPGPVSGRSGARRSDRLTTPFEKRTRGTDTNFGKNSGMTHDTDFIGRMNRVQNVPRAMLPMQPIIYGTTRGPTKNPFGDIDVDTFDMPESPGEILEMEDDMGSLPGSSMTPIHSPVSSPVRKNTKPKTNTNTKPKTNTNTKPKTKTNTKPKAKTKTKTNNKKSGVQNRSHKKGNSAQSKVADKADTVNTKLTIGNVGNRWSTRRRGGKSNTKTKTKTKTKTTTNARSRKGTRR